MILDKGQDVKDLGHSGDYESLNQKIYVHHVEYGGKDDSLFEENAYTIIYLKNTEQIETYALSKEISTNIQNEINRLDGTKMKLMNTTQFQIFSKQHVTKLFERNSCLFTVNEDLDIDKYNRGEQQVYVSRSTIPAEINERLTDPDFGSVSDDLADKINELEEGENLTSYELVNIKLINNVTNSSIRFSKDEKIVYPTHLRFDYDKSWGRQKIFVKGKVDNDFVDIVLKEQESGTTKTGLIKLTPTSTLEKLTCFSDTLDLNISMPYDIASVYATPDYLRKQIVNDNSPWKKSLWRVLLSILELTKAFSNGFAKYQKPGNDGRSGIDPLATIGGIKIGLLSGTSSNDALSAIDGRIEDWKSSNPLHINSNEFKLFKNIILMLSPFIQSELAMSGGLNQGNKIYKLWWFDLRTAITEGFADDDTQDLLVQLKSEYYNISEVGGIITKTYNNVTIEYQAFGARGWKIKIPTTGDKIAHLTKLVRVTYNNNDLWIILADHSDVSPFYEIYTDDPDLNLPSSPANGDTVQRNNITVEFYDTDKRLGDLELKPQFKNLSAYQALDIDGWTSLAELPAQLQALNRMGKPGDIRANSEDITKYWIYVPVNDQASLRRLYGVHNLTTSTGEQEIDLESSGSFTIMGSSIQNIDASVVFDKLVKNQLASNQKMKFISGIPDIRNIRVKTEPIRTRTCIKRGSPTGAVGGTITVCLEYRTDTIGYKYIVDYAYTVIQTGNIKNLTLDIAEAIQDKETFTNFNKFNYNKRDKVSLIVDLYSRNGTSKVQEINQITMMGMWGNEFNITIAGYTQKIVDEWIAKNPNKTPDQITEDHSVQTIWTEINNLEFSSKYDEIMTTTKVNL